MDGNCNVLHKENMLFSNSKKGWIYKDLLALMKFSKLGGQGVAHQASNRKGRQEERYILLKLMISSLSYSKQR